MFRKIIKFAAFGIAWGCTVSCLISMVGFYIKGNDWFILAPRGYVEQVVAAMITGMGWSIPSIVYDIDKLSRIQQVLIQMVVGMTVYLPVSLYMKWIPTNNTGIALCSLLFMVVMALAIWFCFYMYYKGEAKAINRKLAGKEKGNS